MWLENLQITTHISNFVTGRKYNASTWYWAYLNECCWEIWLLAQLQNAINTDIYLLGSEHTSPHDIVQTLQVHQFSRDSVVLQVWPEYMSGITYLWLPLLKIYSNIWRQTINRIEIDKFRINSRAKNPMHVYRQIIYTEFIQLLYKEVKGIKWTIHNYHTLCTFLRCFHWEKILSVQNCSCFREKKQYIARWNENFFSFFLFHNNWFI